MHHYQSSLRAVRTHFGFSQAHLAHYLGIDRTLLTHAEANRRPLPITATWRLLPLLSLLPPPRSAAPANPLPPDPAEATPETLDALQWRLRVCRHEANMLDFKLGRQLPRLLAARHRRVLTMLLAALPPQQPLPALLDTGPPPAGWADRQAADAITDLARFGQQARALLEARRAGLRAEAACLEKVLA